MPVQIQFRRDTAANWTSVDPTLAEGELGLETDTGRWKLGTGVAAWTALPYGMADLPPGGATGNVLVKASGADFDVAWTGPSGVSDILDLPTAETDAALVLAPDGAGGVEFRTEAGGAGGFALDSYAIDPTYGDHFNGASLDAAWTRRNYTSGAEAYQVGKAATYLRIAKAGRAIGDGYFRPAPAGDWTFAMAFIPRFFAASPGSLSWGLSVVDTNGTGVGCFLYGTNPNGLILQGITTYTTFSGNYYQPGSSSANPDIFVFANNYQFKELKIWMYLRKVGTSYYAAYSFDGEAWGPETGAALVWAGTVDRVAMMDNNGNVTSGNGTGSIVDVDWFNKIA